MESLLLYRSICYRLLKMRRPKSHSYRMTKTRQGSNHRMLNMLTENLVSMSISTTRAPTKNRRVQPDPVCTSSMHQTSLEPLALPSASLGRSLLQYLRSQMRSINMLSYSHWQSCLQNLSLIWEVNSVDMMKSMTYRRMHLTKRWGCSASHLRLDHVSQRLELLRLHWLTRRWCKRSFW